MVHTLVYIRGDGSSGTVSVTISSNAISAVTVTNVGSGYTIAYITLADINSAGGGSLSGAELDCIIEPKGGHGFDAKRIRWFFHYVKYNIYRCRGGELW